MLVLNGPALANRITDPAIRALVVQRYSEICDGEPYDYDSHGTMIVVEPGDSVEALERESSCRILRNLFEDTPFGDPDFSPSFEALEEHPHCYEMVYILNDEGFGITFFIPKAAGIDIDLLSLCALYAVPALQPD